MTFIEIADAITKAKESLSDTSLVSACDAMVEKALFLAYRTGELKKNRGQVKEKDEDDENIEELAKEYGLTLEEYKEIFGEDEDETETEEDDFDFLSDEDTDITKSSDTSKDSSKEDSNDESEDNDEYNFWDNDEEDDTSNPTVESDPVPEESEKHFGSRIPEVQTPSFLKKRMEQEKEVEEDDEPSFDDLMAEAKASQKVPEKAADMAQDMLERVEMPEPPKPDKEDVPDKESVPAPEQTPSIQPVPKNPEEKKKALGTFQYDQMALTVSSSDNTKHDEVIITVYPLTNEENIMNCPIFVVLSSPYDVNPVFACSYETDKGNMIRASIDDHEFIVYAEMKDGKFTATAMLSGKSMEAHEVLNVVQHKAHNPKHELLKNGHIKFTYDAGAGVLGQIEVFPFGQNFVYIHKVENFCDMRLYGNNDVAIQTADGRMMQVVIHRKDEKPGEMTERSIMSADLVPFQAG